MSGLIWVGVPPIRLIASRIAARSTTHGTPVKSCKITRAGLNGISIIFLLVFCQSKMFDMVAEVMSNSSQLRTADSSSTRTENGKCLYRLSIQLTLKYDASSPPNLREERNFDLYGFDCGPLDTAAAAAAAVRTFD